MRCPFCQHEETQVIDSRDAEEGTAIRRRRRCSACDRRVTTYERVEQALPVVVKKNGARVEYDKAKLRSSLQLALRKRPVNVEQVDDAVVRIEQKLLMGAEREIHSQHIGEFVMHELKRLDKIAYVRFDSVYKSFADIAEFRSAIEELDK